MDRESAVEAGERPTLSARGASRSEHLRPEKAGVGCEVKLVALFQAGIGEKDERLGQRGEQSAFLDGRMQHASTAARRTEDAGGALGGDEGAGTFLHSDAQVEQV